MGEESRRGHDMKEDALYFEHLVSLEEHPALFILQRVAVDGSLHRCRGQGRSLCGSMVLFLYMPLNT